MDGTMSWSVSEVAQRTNPEPVYDISVHPMLTDRVLETLKRMLPVLAHEAHRNLIPVERIEVRGFVDVEENFDQVVVIQWVNVSPQKALNYWENLGATLEFWMEYLPEELAKIALERISVSVRWTVDDVSP